MSDSRQIVFDTVLEASEAKPILERIKIIRATAEIIGDPKMTKKLHGFADDLARAERRFREFRFKFRQGGKL